jgi:hypothetical protein
MLELVVVLAHSGSHPGLVFWKMNRLPRSGLARTPEKAFREVEVALSGSNGYPEIIVRRVLPRGHLAAARHLYPREFGGDSLLGTDMLSAFAS